MEKKLPKVFANPVEKTTNRSVAYSKKEEVVPEKKSTPVLTGQTIYQKLNTIFNSTKYVYKADVVIKTKDGTLTKKIIGKNQNHLITIDNELIPLSDIIDIEYAE